MKTLAIILINFLGAILYWFIVMFLYKVLPIYNYPILDYISLFILFCLCYLYIKQKCNEFIELLKLDKK